MRSHGFRDSLGGEKEYMHHREFFLPASGAGAEVHSQERKMEEGPGRDEEGSEPCHRTLGGALLEGGNSAPTHSYNLHIFPGICHPEEYSIGGLGWHSIILNKWMKFHSHQDGNRCQLQPKAIHHFLQRFFMSFNIMQI